MHTPTVLVIAGDLDVEAIESAVRRVGTEITVRPLSDLGDLFEALCYDVVDCLVVPSTVEEASAVDVAHGVRGLFPDLPIVITGLATAAVPADLSVRAVAHESVSSEQAAEAIASALENAEGSAAAREPSRMETLLLSMLDQFPVHLYAKDTAARHVITSRHAQDPTSLIGLTDLDYMELPREHREAAFQDDLEVITDDDPLLEVEEYTDYVDEHTLTSKVPWHDADGEVVGLAGMTRDITERKRREHAARRQHELLVKMALVTAHEFRNELQIAQGRLELVEQDPTQLDVIERSHTRLSRIVDKVIALASRERHERDPVTVWLSTISRAVWDTLEAGEATLTIGDDARFVADPESTSLLLQILFTNAIEHAGPEVSVTVEATEHGFTVADDGPGIEADPPERVFDAAYTTEADNTGFGLYVARSIAAEHGWTISIADDGSPGAAFEVGKITDIDT